MDAGGLVSFSIHRSQSNGKHEWHVKGIIKYSWVFEGYGKTARLDGTLKAELHRHFKTVPR